MKKIMLVTSLVVILCLLMGCEVTTPAESYVDSDGTSVTVNDYGTSYVIEQLPKNIIIDDKSISLETVNFYQIKGEHGYQLYATVKINAENLTEDDKYWINKNDKLDFNIYINSQENDYDNKSMMRIHTADLENTRTIYFWLSDESRYSFETATYDISARIVQDAKYDSTDNDGEDIKLNKEDSYYLFDHPVSDGALPSLDDLGPEDNRAFYEGLTSVRDTYKALLGE